MATIQGYTLNKMSIYSGYDADIFSGIRNTDKEDVVIKLLKDEHLSTDNIARFKHEYEMAKTCETVEEVIKVYALEKCGTSYAIIMENIPLPTLEKILKLKNKIKINDFLELAISMAEALGQVHQRGIIHKDINPSNIMCDFNRRKIKLIDFGLSATLAREHVEILSPNVLEGSLSYLSPEQTGRMNRGIDYRTDYYALGVVFYQMLTGQLPFSATDPMELVHCHIAVTPKVPHEIDPAIPPVISFIVIKLLEKKAEDRYQNTNGLIADLKECYRALKETGTIELFPLGTHDVFSRFQIAEKLYGRENEVNALMDTYERVMKGNVELMLVAGYSGIGKSSLVNEIHKPIVRKHGYFVSGKFDQFKQNIPYAAVTQAFDEFVKQLLTESEELIAIYRQKILDAVGKNGQVIVDVVPHLATLIGKQMPVAELEPTESQNRFSYVFQKFITALAAADHPLVIFLDDLQWVDLASVKMLETLLTSTNCHYLFIIGAYRSNEVSSDHPLIMSLEKLKKRNIIYNTIDLGPLNEETVAKLIADTLHRDPVKVQLLAKICFEKTGGNPFFLVQLLLALHQEQLIEFDARLNQWTWNIDKIQEKGFTDNIVDLMINKLSQLSPAVQQALQFAACIGNQFNLNVLANLCKKEPVTLLIELQEALKEGYILSKGESYRAVSYYFAHDRIQQAAHTMLDEKVKKLIHIELARLLLKRTIEEKLAEVIFDIANHYNMGIETEIPDIIQEEEKRKIAEINLFAAKTAKMAAAFELALRYAETAMRCKDDSDWRTDYPFMFDLYAAAAEAAYLSGFYDLTEQYAVVCLRYAQSTPDEIRIIQIQLSSLVSQNKQRAAVDLTRNTLIRLGTRLPANPKTIHVLAAIMKMKLSLLFKKTPNLLNLPEMTDPTNKAIVRLITSSISSAYQVLPNMLPLFVCTGLKLSLQYGNTRGSAMAYAFYGVFLCGALLEIESGYQFGDLALNLIDKFDDQEVKTKVSFANYAFIKHWRDPLRDSLPKLIETFENGLNAGDPEYACYCILFYTIHAYFSGIALNDLLSNVVKYKIRLGKLQQVQNDNYMSIYHQLILNLVETKNKPTLLIGDGFNENKQILILIDRNDRSGLFLLYFSKIILAYFFHKTHESFKEIIQLIHSCDTYVDAALSTKALSEFNFYKSLSMLMLYPFSSLQEQKKIKEMLGSLQKKMRKWLKFCPSSYLHQYLLIEAERAWIIDNQLDKAGKLYDQAIRAAKQNEFINDEALANELAAKFYLVDDREKIARTYMEEAKRCYRIWGADAIVARLDEQYPQLLGRTISNSQMSLSLRGSFSASGNIASQVFNISTLQKFSEIISSTIILDELLRRLMRIVIENAGAEKSYLLLNKDGHYFIEVTGRVQEGEIKVELQSIEIADANLPRTLIDYTARTKELIVLDDATQSEQFMNDPYISKNKLKSVLCMPLLNQGTLSAILYMENNLIEGAFTQDHINILNLLSSQSVVSLENAKLYHKATHDPLTGLANRNLMYQLFLETSAKMKQQGKQMALLFLDLDCFKIINDTLGHEVGDKVLLYFAEKLKLLRTHEEDLIVRLGGDEFVVLIIDAQLEQISHMAAQFLKSINNTVLIDGHAISIGASIGISLFPEHGEDISLLLRNADIALYQVKKTEKGHYHFFERKA